MNKFQKNGVWFIGLIVALSGCSFKVAHSINVIQGSFDGLTLNLPSASAFEDDVVSFDVTSQNEELVIDEVYVNSIGEGAQSISCTSTGATYSFVMPNSDVEIGAITSFKEYNITFAENADVVFSYTGSEKAKKGEMISFSFDKANDEVIVDELKVLASGESVNYSENQGIYTFEMPNKDVTISCVTSYKKYLINFINDSNLSYTLCDHEDGESCGGETVSFTIDILNSEVLLDSVEISAGQQNVSFELESGVYTFEMPTSDVSISANTSFKTYSIAVTNNENVNFEFVSTKSAYEKGDTVEFTATAKTGYKLALTNVKTSGGATVNYSSDTSYSFEMPNDNVVISFETENLYTISLAQDTNSTVTIENQEDYYESKTTVNFTIAFADSYELDSLSVTTSDGEVQITDSEGVYSFTMPAANVTITVSSKEIVTSKDPFTTKTTFEGSWDYYDGYYSYTMRLRIIFSGSGTLSWYLTYKAEDDGWGEWYYAIRPDRITKPSSMEGDYKDGRENLTYTYDSSLDQVLFNTGYKMSTKDVKLQLVRNGTSITSCKMTENLSSDFYQTGNRVLNKI